MKSNSQNINDVKKISLTGMFLAITFMLTWIQIPVPFLANFLSLDFSLIAILIARRYISLSNALIISTIAPWAAMLAFWSPADLIGVMILIFMNIIVVVFDWIFTRNISNNIKKEYILSFFTMITSTAIILFLNLIFFTPLYWGFDWKSLLSDGVWKYIVSWSSIYIPFNLLKLSAVFIVYPLVNSKIMKIT